MNTPNDNYKVLDACINCKHCFECFDYDDPSAYYCTEDDKPRPLSGSVALHEAFCDAVRKKGVGKDADDEYYREWAKLRDAFSEWANEHSVESNGKCDKFIKAV